MRCSLACASGMTSASRMCLRASSAAGDGQKWYFPRELNCVYAPPSDVMPGSSLAPYGVVLNPRGAAGGLGGGREAALLEQLDQLGCCAEAS